METYLQLRTKYPFNEWNLARFLELIKKTVGNLRRAKLISKSVLRADCYSLVQKLILFNFTKDSQVSLKNSQRLKDSDCKNFDMCVLDFKSILDRNVNRGSYICLKQLIPLASDLINLIHLIPKAFYLNMEKSVSFTLQCFANRQSLEEDVCCLLVEIRYLKRIFSRPMITLITLLVHYMIDLMPLKYEEQQLLVVLQIAITENHEGEQTF